jgi:hypothetical protein
VKSPVALLLALFLTPLAYGQGLIQGTVRDENGKPLAGANVHIQSTHRHFGRTVLEFHTTDRDGKFTIESVPWGTYSVLAGKEESGYPDTKLIIYATRGIPKVTVSPSSPIGTVVVLLGPKAALLRINSVRDRNTGAAIRAPAITVRLAAKPTVFLTASTTLGRIFVPANTDVVVDISASGYATWPNPPRKIQLKPAETLVLDAVLHPKQQAAVKKLHRGKANK